VSRFFLAVASATTLVVALSAVACSGGGASTTTGKPGEGALVNSDSIVTATIEAIVKQSTGYPWKLEVLIQNTQDVGVLINPVKDSVGKTITVATDENMTSYKVNDVVTAKVKYTGDVNIPAGITLYMYNVALK
jgi:hypothetical protein